MVDTSALVAVASREPDWLDYLSAIQRADRCYLSPINYVEMGIVLVTRGSIAAPDDLDLWLDDLRVIVRHDLPLADRALETYLRYGKGAHPARLNLADTFSYALASILGLPLLYKGEDFALTDIRSALQPT